MASPAQVDYVRGDLLRRPEKTLHCIILCYVIVCHIVCIHIYTCVYVYICICMYKVGYSKMGV